MVIGLMVAGILSGFVSAAFALVAGHSLPMALLAYALGGFAASVVTILVMLVRVSQTPAVSSQCNGRIVRSGTGCP